MSQYPIPNMHGVLVKKDELEIPALYMESVHGARIMFYRLWLTNDEAKIFSSIFHPDWQIGAVSYEEVKEQVSIYQDELWQQMLIEFQLPIYGDENFSFKHNKFPTIHCSKAWLREFAKFYNGQQTWEYGYDAEPVYLYSDVVAHVEKRYIYRINSCSIEIVERDDIWAQYKLDSLCVTSLGYAVVIDDLSQVV
jgi:hypothetical protein